MVERLPCKQEVVGSIPTFSTRGFTSRADIVNIWPSNKRLTISCNAMKPLRRSRGVLPAGE